MFFVDMLYPAVQVWWIVYSLFHGMFRQPGKWPVVQMDTIPCVTQMGISSQLFMISIFLLALLYINMLV